jgi:hypothetical protein
VREPSAVLNDVNMVTNSSDEEDDELFNAILERLDNK